MNHQTTPFDKIWKTKQNTCEKTTCGHLFYDESKNCVNECTSQTCYDEVYSDNPLEDGEIDHLRAYKYLHCLRREERRAFYVLQREKQL